MTDQLHKVHSIGDEGQVPVTSLVTEVVTRDGDEVVTRDMVTRDR